MKVRELSRLLSRHVIACGLLAAGLPVAASADTAAPTWTLSYGRLVEPTPVPGPVAPIAADQTELGCLAQAVAYEAGTESPAGQAAVAEVVLNRVRHPGFPKTVCGVVNQGSTRRTGCQFTFTCDGSLRRVLSARTRAAARRIAEAALAGTAPALLAGATHYHADYVRPYWAPAMFRIATIGAHIFYRFPGRQSVAPSAAPPPRFAPWGLSLPPG